MKKFWRIWPVFIKLIGWMSFGIQIIGCALFGGNPTHLGSEEENNDMSDQLEGGSDETAKRPSAS